MSNSEIFSEAEMQIIVEAVRRYWGNHRKLQPDCISPPWDLAELIERQERFKRWQAQEREIAQASIKLEEVALQMQPNRMGKWEIRTAN